MEAIVEYNYDAQEPDELTLRKGDIIKNIRVMPGGWWEGTCRDKRGMFPDNFVKTLEPCSSNSSNILPEVKNEIEGLKMERKDEMKKKWCKVLFKYDASNDDELSLVPHDIIEYLGEVEDGWWSGCLKGRVGVFPSNFVAPPEELESTKEYCRVLFPYDADNDDELTLIEGEIITLITRDAPDKGWWKGELRGKIGLFPDNFVEVISSKHLPPSLSPQSHQQQQQSSDSNRSSLNSLKQLSLGKKSGKDKKSFESTVEKKLPPPPSKASSSSSPTSHSILSNLQRVIMDKNSTSSVDSGSKVIDPGIENNFDKVEREEEAPLSHLTVLRAKAPRRRLPSTYVTHKSQVDSSFMNIAQNSSMSPEKENAVTNGNLDTVDQPRDKDTDVSAKTRQCVPWIKELKQNQMEKKKSFPMDKFDIANVKKDNHDDEDDEDLISRDKESDKELDTNLADSIAPPTASRKTPAYVPYRLYYQLLDRVTTLEEKQTVLQRTVAQLSEQLGPLLANESAANKI